jgi:hypothetical protein
VTALVPPRKWQSIPGFANYEIDTHGNACRVWRYVSGEVKKYPLLPDIDKRGRKRFALCLNGKARRILASRLVLMTFIGPCPDGMEACHENGDCTDNRLENLRWDTHSSNLLDRRRHGTNVQGEMVNTAKLTEDAVREIRRVGYPVRQHAVKFGVSEALISQVLKRRIWQHVQ